jgi:hypothetical protein
MAIVLSETFATGVPSGFATQVVNTGSFTATYNPTQQAVDLSKDNFNGGWRFDTVSASVELDVEMDVECTDIQTVNFGTFFGLFLGVSSGSGDGALIAYSRIVRDGGSSGGLNAGGVNWGFGSAVDIEPPGRPLFEFAVGERKLIRIKTNVSGSDRIVETVVAGQPHYKLFRAVNSFTGLVRPTLFLRNGSIRLHSIVIRDDAVITEPAKVGVVSRSAIRHFTPNTFSSLGANVGKGGARKNIHQSGTGLIQGTVTIENIPGSRQVRLFDRKTGLIYGETWSSETGFYEFRGVDQEREYFIVAHDHFRVYNAVVSDMLNP